MATRTPRILAPTSERDSEFPNAPWFLQRPFLLILVVAAVVYHRLFSAGFVAFDDDIHVYANPFLNPPSLQSIATFWQRPYEQLYIPLAYTISAAIAHIAQVASHTDNSIGHIVSIDPAAFHATSVAFHLANTWLCYLLVTRLARNKTAATVCSFVFAIHPLQVESVAWISEVRGLSSGFFALLALHGFILFREWQSNSRPTRTVLAGTVISLVCAILCKPSAAALPLVSLAIDRTMLSTPWRKAAAAAFVGALMVTPFVVLTRVVQAIPTAALSVWWQRPLIAGDALAFYLLKVIVPTDLCVDYGRTPASVMSHAWGYFAWVVPVILLAIAYRNRHRRRLTWLGAQLFVAFLLPTVGLVPFAYQAYSTVADRYMYLPLIGIGLLAADALEYAKPRHFAVRAASAALVVLAVISFRQIRYWRDSSDLLRHTIDTNPRAAFAYNNLGDTELANGDLSAALSDYTACVEQDPSRVKAHINLAEIYSALNEPAKAEGALAKALSIPGMTADDFSNLGITLMKMNQPERALQALATATKLEPIAPAYLFNQANALAAVGQFEKAEAAYRRCLALAPTLANAHMGLGIVLAEQHRLGDAIAEFRAALRLQPNDLATRDNLRRAEEMLAAQHP